VLDKVAEVFGFSVEYSYADIGGIAIDKTGDPLPSETLEMCKKSDAVLLGPSAGRNGIIFR